MSLLELVLGVVIVLITLWDAFETVVLPRTVQRRLRLSRLISLMFWLPWTTFARLLGASNRRESVLAMYGPLLLILLVAVWAISLVFGFGLIHHALTDLSPIAADSGMGLMESIYFSGSTFFTLGLGDLAPLSTASRAVTVTEAGVGFGFLALVIGYLPVFYQAFSRREVAISLLDSRAGSPPTALELIHRNGEGVTDRLLAEWEGWTAELLESHLSYPILSFFRSQHEKQSWLAALTVILDTSALIIAGIDRMPNQQQARFTFAMARHALVDLAQTFFVEPRSGLPERLTEAEFAVLRALLSAYGFPLKDGPEAAAALTDLRHGYEPIASALSERLLLELPPWIPARDTQDDWQTSPWDTLPPLIELGGSPRQEKG